MQMKSLIEFILILSFIATWSLVLFFIGPHRIVGIVGEQNALVVAFIIAALGGVSTITATSFYTTIITLASGGVNPYLLGVVAGCGITIGDSLFYYLGKTGRDSLSGKPRRWSKELTLWLDNRPS